MKFKLLFIIVLILILSSKYLNSEYKFPVLKGNYLGQKPPGLAVKIFAEGIVSTKKEELSSVFTPDMKEFYFTLDENKVYKIMVMKRKNNIWTKPQLAKFSGKYDDLDMFISKYGDKFYFCSHRPLQNGPPSKGFRIWVMKREGSEWGDSKLLGENINFGKSQVYPSLDNNGTIYFQSRPGKYGLFDIYKSEFTNGSFQKPENLGPQINTRHSEGDAFIAPDNSFLIVTSMGREDSLGDADLYISFKKNKIWTKLKNMGPKINSKSTEHCPILSPDGKYFFFTSNRRGSRDIFWIDAKFIANLRLSFR